MRKLWLCTAFTLVLLLISASSFAEDSDLQLFSKISFFDGSVQKDLPNVLFLARAGHTIHVPKLPCFEGEPPKITLSDGKFFVDGDARLWEGKFEDGKEFKIELARVNKTCEGFYSIVVREVYKPSPK